MSRMLWTTLNKDDGEGHQSWRGRGSQSSIISSEMTTPSAPFRCLRSIFSMAQPPLLFQEGTTNLPVEGTVRYGQILH